MWVALRFRHHGQRHPGKLLSASSTERFPMRRQIVSQSRMSPVIHIDDEHAIGTQRARAECEGTWNPAS